MKPIYFRAWQRLKDHGTTEERPTGAFIIIVLIAIAYAIAFLAH